METISNASVTDMPKAEPKPALMETRPLHEVAGLKFLDAAQCRFYRLEEDFLGLEHEGKDHGRVSLHRALPIQEPDAFLFVLDKEGAEIGILRTLVAFSEEQAALLRQELEFRYYCPRILRLYSAKERMGYVYLEIGMAAGRRTLAVKDVGKSIRRLDGERILILDVDGNRYLVEDFSRLDRTGRKLLEPYLF